MPVATCQPTAAERARVPHHLLGFLDASETMTAGRFGALARERAADIASRGKRVLLVGGTGLYLRAALEGLIDVPSADAALRARLLAEAEQYGRPALHARLAKVDPESAARLNANDLVRVVRSLELHALTGVSQTELYRRHRRESPSVRWLAVALEREVLYARIEARTRAIFDGLIAEAQALHARGLGGAPASRALGIAEALRYLRGEQSRAEALAATLQATRRYAKRQLTWFRAEPAIEWRPAAALDPDGLARELQRAS